MTGSRSFASGLLLGARLRGHAALLLTASLWLAACGTSADRPIADDAPAAATDSVMTAYHRPVFSPTGDRLAFMRRDASTHGDWELFLANVDGVGTVRLTTHPGWDGYAVWSPDGGQLIFDRDDGEKTAKYSVILDLASKATRRLGNFEGWLTINTWALDGRLYAFWEKDGQRDLYALNPSGEVVERLTDTPDLSEGGTQASSDGKTLFFTVERLDGSGSGIASLDLVTKRRSTILESKGRIYGLALSPDGRTLAYTDNPEGGEDDAEIFLVDLPTRTRRQLTDNTDWDHMPVFHPSGAYLLFTSYRQGSELVYRLALADGAITPFEVQE